MKILGIIPARYESSRFPGKPLADIAGKSMIQRVYEQSSKVQAFTKVLVATDHKKIYEHVLAFGGNVVITSPAHPTGTDRCYEALHKEDKYYEFVINIQGDEPFISPAQIELLLSVLNPAVELATLVKKIDREEELNDPNEAKVVINKNMEGIYFSRSPIPYQKDTPKSEWIHKHVCYKHIGIYSYRSDVLDSITKLPVSALEKAESLEQLRWIENGYAIKVAITNIDSMSIDTPEDIEKAVRLFT